MVKCVCPAVTLSFFSSIHQVSSPAWTCLHLVHTYTHVYIHIQNLLWFSVWCNMEDKESTAVLAAGSQAVHFMLWWCWIKCYELTRVFLKPPVPVRTLFRWMWSDFCGSESELKLSAVRVQPLLGCCSLTYWQWCVIKCLALGGWWCNQQIELNYVVWMCFTKCRTMEMNHWSHKVLPQLIFTLGRSRVYW